MDNQMDNQMNNQMDNQMDNQSLPHCWAVCLGFPELLVEIVGAHIWEIEKISVVPSYLAYLKIH